MVCLGNICRSPIAEGIMQNKLNQAGIAARVDSAGLINYHTGELPDKRSIAVAAKYGIDISVQRARSFTKDDIKNFDYIFAMDNNNYENLLEYANDATEAKRIHLLLDYAGLGKKIVPDPYYGDQSDFEHVFSLLDDACQRILKKFAYAQSAVV